MVFFSKIIHVLNIIVWFFLPVPKKKFDPPPQGKIVGVQILGSSLKSINLDVEI